MHRLQGVSSLVNRNAFYHIICYTRFINRKPSKNKKRIVNEEYDISWQHLSNYVKESEKFQFSVSELQNILDDESLSVKVLLKSLKHKYDDEDNIVQHRDRNTVIYYKYNASKVCNE